MEPLSPEAGPSEPGPHTSLNAGMAPGPDPTTQRLVRKILDAIEPPEVGQEDQEEDTVCRKCKSPLDGGRMILCDGCDTGCHLYCASPALSSIPSGEWFCDKCVAARAPPPVPVLSPPRLEGKRQIAPVTPNPHVLLGKNVKRFRGGLVFKAHRLVYHSTLGLRVIKKKVTSAWRHARPRPCPSSPLRASRASARSSRYFSF